MKVRLMQNARHRFFSFSSLLAAVILLGTVCTRPAAAGDRHIQNVQSVREGETYLIRYDLTSGPGAERHEINIVLRRRGDESFMYRPVNLSGDFGRGIAGGEGREIRWAYRDEFPDGLQESDFYFEVLVDSGDTSPDERPFLLRTPVLIGAGAVVGGVLAIVLSSGRDDQPSPPAQPPRFAMPPGRP
jgi:hypothetical protein